MTDRAKRIEPAERFSPGIGRFVWQLEDVRRRLFRYVERLTPEQLAWYPNARVESIGTQLLHIAGVEFSYIQEDILGREMSREEWQHAFPIRLGIPQIADAPLEHFVSVLDRVRVETLDILSELADADLQRVIVPPDPAAENQGVSYTIEWILYHLIEHEAHHKGQIALMLRLLPDSLHPGR